MREILFRGKRKDNDEWIEGSLILTTAVCQKAYIVDSCWCEHGKVTEEGFADFNWLNAFEVFPETVGQYTGGLTDKNGKRIFAGDIIKHYYDNTDKSMFDIGVILFDDKVCQFKRNSRVNTRYYNIHFECEYEVIGNIHDNPELLKGEEENA